MSKNITNSGDGSDNITASDGSTVNKININIAQQQKLEDKKVSIIDNIIKNVVETINLEELELENTDNTVVGFSDKVKINFSDTEDQDQVIAFYRDALQEIVLIEKRIQQENNSYQRAITQTIRLEYNELRKSESNNMNILLSLIDKFYNANNIEEEFLEICRNVTIAFVLFFFDDCTIFKKK